MRRATAAGLLGPLVRLGMAMALLVIVLVAILAFSATSSLVRAFNAVRQTREVEMSITDLLSATKDAETGQRGYLLTGRIAYLQPYTDARAAVLRDLTQVRTLTADDSYQQQQVQQLQPLITAKFAELDETVALRRDQGLAAAAAVVATDRGKILMDQIRAVGGAMHTHEVAQETMERATAEQAAQLAFRTVAIGGIATFVVMALANLVILRELRQRKSAEQALEAQFREADAAHHQISAVLNATDEAIVLVSRDRRFMSVNRRFVELFGIPAATLLGRRFDDLQALFAQVFADAAAFGEQITGSAADGRPEFGGSITQQWPERRDLEFFSAVVPATGGGVLGRLYVFRDVTRERAADRLKTEFVSLVSHELRTPLTSIKGYIDLLVAGEVGPLNAEQMEFADIAKSNADRLMALINDLLDISRIEAGKVELRRVPLAMAPLLRQVAAALRPQLEAKRQTLTLTIHDHLPVILGDADRLVQVFTNLLSNATKYTPGGGAIGITAQAEDGALRVDVTDTGIGLAPQDLDRLYTKFFRSSHRLVREAGGTGLGLTITRSLVELHGGSIQVRSTPEAGSTFTVVLPALLEGADAAALLDREAQAVRR